MARDRTDWLALVLCLLFFVTGSLWISEGGIQNDEALFSAAIYPPFPADGSGTMVMNYVGALKSRLWKPILKIWPPSPASVRLPAVALGALTVWLFYRLLKRVLGSKTALIGAALLATDTSFLLTTRWDWGPVVLQHLCLVAGLLSVVRFAQEKRLIWLAAGFFAFGLGVWDKTIFLWSLVGLGVAVLAVFPRRVIELVSFKSAAVAVLAFVVGAFPLIQYNWRHDWVTFRENAAWSSEILYYKAGLVAATVNGRALFGKIARDEWDGPIRQPDDPAKRAMVAFSGLFGGPRRNLYLYLLILCVVLLPFVWKTPARSAFLFSLVYCVVTWLQMAFTKNAGTGAHHPILMWPMPHLGMAAILARLALPWATGIVAVVCVSGLVTTATYYTNLLRNGAVAEWTDAIYPASRALPALKPSFVCVLDWGFFEPIRLLSKGRIQMCAAADPERDPDIVRRQLQMTEAVYISHARGKEVQPGLSDRFTRFAESEGYSKTSAQIFHDFNGRPIIEIFKLSTTPMDYTSQIEKWRADREARLKAPDGWLSVAGLDWLQPGENRVKGGVMTLDGETITFRPDSGGPARPIKSNSNDYVEVNGVKLFIIHRGIRYGVRTRDNNSEYRRNFTGLHWYPVDPSWRVNATYKPLPEPKKTYFDSQTGDKQEMIIPGAVEFEREGKTFHLSPVLEEGELFFVFRDTTAGKTTYPAARFLYAKLPPGPGPVELDFNKAYNPPCVFTPYATCPLPPPENRLSIPVEAGEKKYHP